MPRNDRPPYFYFYPDDFSSDRNVESMSTGAVGAYILLICKAWHEEPAASLPDDDGVLARWARMDLASWSRIRAEVLGAFKKGKDGRWYQKRLGLEYQKLCRVLKSKSEGGRNSAEKRKLCKSPPGVLQDSSKTLERVQQHRALGLSNSSSEASSSEEARFPSSKRCVLSHRDVYAQTIDEQWVEFKKIAMERTVLPGSSNDWNWAWVKWKILSVEQRAAAVNDCKVRPEYAVEFTARPQNYLECLKWECPMPKKPHRNRTKTEDMFADA